MSLFFSYSSSSSQLNKITCFFMGESMEIWGSCVHVSLFLSGGEWRELMSAVGGLDKSSMGGSWVGVGYDCPSQHVLFFLFLIFSQLFPILYFPPPQRWC